MKNNIGKIIAALVIVGLVVWMGFYFINNRGNRTMFPGEEADSTGEVQTLINKNLDNAHYPANVREVVKLYQRIHICLMTKGYSEEEYYALLDQMRLLFDNELLIANPRDVQAANYKKEIEPFKKNKGGIPVSGVQLQSEVQTFTNEEGENMATIVAYFLVKNGSDVSNTYEKFLLREDSNGNWKIVGWQLTDPVDIAFK